MAQTTYSLEMARYFPGMKSSLVPDTVETGVNTEATAEMPFGVCVIRDGTTEQGRKLPSAAGDRLLGVVLHSHDYHVGQYLGTTGLKPGTTLNVMTKGRVAVQVETAVSPGDRAWVRYAGTGQRGGWRNANVAGETIEVRGAVFRTGASAGGVAEVEVDFLVQRSHATT